MVNTIKTLIYKMKGIKLVCRYHKATDPVKLVNSMVPEKYISRNTENRYFCFQ